MWEILPFIVVLLLFAAVPKIKLAGLNPQSIEFMERDIVDSSAEYTGNKIIPTVVDGNECGAYILVTLDGNDEDEIFQRAENAGRNWRRNGRLRYARYRAPSRQGGGMGGAQRVSHGNRGRNRASR